MKGLEGVLGAAAEVQGFCMGRGWKFCFIGGVAVQRWGTPRFTQDVDLTLLTGFGGEKEYIDALLAVFPGRIKNARQFALEHRVLLAKTNLGVQLDFALGAFPFEEECIERASTWKIRGDRSLLTCSAEDLVIHKVFASRDRDWADVESVLARQHGKLDLSHIRQTLPELLELKGNSEAMSRFEELVEQVESRLGE